MSNAPTGGRPTKNERREQAREQARQLREEARRRDRRNKVLLQGGIIVGVLAVVAIIALVIVNSVTPAGPGPKNMASGGVLLVSDGDGGIKVQTTAGLADGADPVPSDSDAQIRIQTFIDLFCPICDQFELGLSDVDGDGEFAQSDLDLYNAQSSTPLAGSPEDYTGNLEYIKTLIEQGIASLEVFPVAILDNYSQGTSYSTRSANAADCVAAEEPDSFLDFIEGMFEQQPAENTSGLDDATIIQIAKDAGADSQEVADCITNQTYKKWVTKTTTRAKNFEFAAEANVDQSNGFGTPIVVVNDQQYRPTDTWANNAAFRAYILQLAGEAFSDESQTPSPTDTATPPAG